MLAALSLAACGGPPEGGAAGATGAVAAPRQGGTYNYPLSADPHPFDPGLNQYDGGNAVLHQVYEGLVRWELQPDGTLKAAPCLAEKWDANADCTEWTFRLRRGVGFQAPVSRELTAADVVRDLRYLADPGSVEVMDRFVPEEQMLAGTEMAIFLRDIAGTDASGLARQGPLGVKALGRYTVRFTLKHPYSEFPESVGGPAFWIWPDDYRRKVGPEAYAEHPVGTGPYVFLQRSRGRSIDLVRNPEWWDTTGGPYIEHLHFQIFDSADDMLLAFRKGLIDWTRVAPDKVGGSRTAPQVEDGHWTAESDPVPLTQLIEVNMKDPVVGGRRGLPLRQALSYGCDSQAVIDAVTDGSGIAANGLAPPGILGSRPVRSPYAYDPAKAAELYRQAGSPVVELAYPAPFMRSIAESVPPAYAASGIVIRLKGMRQAPFWESYDLGKLQVVALGWSADYPSIDNFLYPMFHTGSPANSARYSNKQVDTLLDKARATLDPEARAQIYVEAERQILADAPVVPLYVPTESRLLDTRVANVHFDPMGWVDLWRAWVR